MTRPMQSTILERADIEARIREAAGRLERGEASEAAVVLDLAQLARLDVEDLALLRELVPLAAEARVRLVLDGLHVEAYKVLQLAGLSHSFGFTG